MYLSLRALRLCGSSSSMGRSGIRLLRSLLLGVAAALLSCVLLALVLPQAPPDERVRERTAAEARWAARPFARYRLVLQDRFCHQDVEIHGDQVVTVFRNTCEHPAWTIADLFRLIARDQTVSIPCIAMGCACDDILTVRATYDPTLGYPQTIRVRVHATPNWRHPDYWKRAWMMKSLPNCDVLMDGSKTIKVHALTPLPGS